VSYAASILCLTTSTLASAAIDSADDPSAYNMKSKITGARSQGPDQNFRSFNETKSIVKLQFNSYNRCIAELNEMTDFNVPKPKVETRQNETYSDPEFLRTFLSFWRMEETAERRETASSRRRMTSRVARGTRRRAAELCSSSDAAISSDTIWSFISMSTRCLSKES